MGWPWKEKKKRGNQEVMGPHPLQTERLVLRAFDITDAMDVFSYAKNPQVALAAGFAPHRSLEESRAAVKRYMARGDMWAMVEKKTGRVVGAMSLQKDIRRDLEMTRMLGYSIGEDWWGQGFATEAGQAMLQHAFGTLECPIVTAYHFPDNPRSERVLKKLGFVYEGELRMAQVLPDGGVCGERCYSLTAEEYARDNADRQKA